MNKALRPPEELPLFPIRGCILLPGEHLPLNVFEPRYLNMVDDAVAAHGFLGIVQPRRDGPRDRPRLEAVGCAGRIASHAETEDGRYLIVLEGVARFALAAEIDRPTPYRLARADYAPFAGDLAAPAGQAGIAREDFLALLQRFFAHAGLEADWESLSGAPLTRIADKVAMAAPFDAAAKQALLEAPDPVARLRTLSAMMSLALDTSGGHPGA